MSLWSQLLSPPRATGSAAARLLGGSTMAGSDTGVFIDEERSLQVGAAFACISFIARTKASLPRRITRREDRSRKEVRTDEFRHLWGPPSRVQAGLSFWETLTAAQEGWGNGYVWTSRDSAVRYDERRPWIGVRELVTLYPQRVDVGVFPDGSKGYRLDRSMAEPYTAERILHIPSFSADGVHGLSPVRVGAQALGLSIAAEKFASLFFKNGSTLSGIITSEAVVTPEQASEVIEGWDEEHKGLNNAHLMGVMGGNAKYERVGIPPNEAQMLETRQFQREEVVQFYGPIPHHLLGWKSNTSNFGTGIENQNIGVLMFVMLNRLKRDEEYVEQFLLPPDLQLRFNVAGLLRADTKAQESFFRTMRQNAIFSADQILELLDLPPRGIPDDFLMPTNMVRIAAADGKPLPALAEGPNGRRPALPPGRAMVMEEARCPSPGCHRLLAKHVVAADLWCERCKAERPVRNGAFVEPGAPMPALVLPAIGRLAEHVLGEATGVRDTQDLADALVRELQERL